MQPEYNPREHQHAQNRRQEFDDPAPGRLWRRLSCHDIFRQIGYINRIPAIGSAVKTDVGSNAAGIPRSGVLIHYGRRNLVSWQIHLNCRDIFGCINYMDISPAVGSTVRLKGGRNVA
jgi:hypothetical protein